MTSVFLNISIVLGIAIAVIALVTGIVWILRWFLSVPPINLNAISYEGVPTSLKDCMVRISGDKEVPHE